MKKFLLNVIVGLLTITSCYAYDFENEGLCYSITSNSNSNLTCSVAQKSTFSGYSGSIVIPRTVSYEGKNYTVTGIGDNAFAFCDGLTSITIPNTVAIIADNAFFNCTGLKDVYNLAITPQPITTMTFDPTPTCLHVYQGYKNIFANANGWESFTIKDDIQIIQATNIKLNNSNINCSTYNSVRLVASITPSNASISDLDWSSSNPEIAQVTSDGIVYGIKEGTATITVKTKDGSNLNASCTVNVANAGESFNYNDYLDVKDAGSSFIQIGSNITKSINFNLINNGSNCIKLTRITAKNSNTYEEVATTTNENVLGWLCNGMTKTFTITIHKNINLVYEIQYLFRDKEYTYYSDMNDPTLINYIQENTTDKGNRIFNIDGTEIPALHKGINIIKYADGKVKKVLVK